MPGTTTSKLAAIIDEFMMLVKESGDYHRLPELKNVFAEGLKALITLRRRLTIAEDRYVVAVVGLTNVGKSTLLNALLGVDLPRRNGPCTAIPIEFAYGESLRLTVYYRQGLERPTWACSTQDDLCRRLASHTEEGSEGAKRGIRKAVVHVPHSLLQTGLVIADTPGFGAAQVNEMNGSHEETLKHYLGQEVSQIFWVVLAEQGIGKREKSYYDQFLAEVCDDLVVTGCEDWNGQDRERFRRRFSDALGPHMPTFHFVSGLEGLNPKKREEAGIKLLETRIQQLSDAAGRIKAQEARLLQLAGDLRSWLDDFRDDRRAPLFVRWRPDSWRRWLACHADNHLKKRLEAQLGNLP